jgi:hypothetical protein
VSTAVLIALPVASVRYARPWAETPHERPMFVRAYRSLNGMMDQVREGFRPDFAVLVEFIDSDDLSTSWHLDHHAMHARRDDVHHGDFTGRRETCCGLVGS